MDLKLKDVAELFQVSEKTIYRWVQAGKLPSYRINHQYRFKREEIEEWLLMNRESVSDSVEKLVKTSKRPPAPEGPASVAHYLSNGGIYYNIEGRSVKEVLAEVVQTVRLPAEITADEALGVLISREEMSSTAFGEGIAFPHPREPMTADVSQESLSICFLSNPIDFEAIDQQAVEVLFVIFSADSTRHVQLLSHLSHLCRSEEFVSFIKTTPTRTAIREFVSR